MDGSKKTADGQYVRYVQMDHKQSIWNYRQEAHVSNGPPRDSHRRHWPRQVQAERFRALNLDTVTACFEAFVAQVPFLKIATVWPQHVTTARTILETVTPQWRESRDCCCEASA